MTYYAVAAVTWIIALSIVPLTIAISDSAFAYVGFVLMSALVFVEMVPPIRWVAVGFIVISMAVVASTA